MQDERSPYGGRRPGMFPRASLVPRAWLAAAAVAGAVEVGVILLLATQLVA